VNIEPWKLVASIVAVLALLALSLPTGADLGWAYLADHRYAEAQRKFADLLARDPGDAELWVGMAAVQEALGAPDRQIAALEDASRRAPRRRDILIKLADAYDLNKNPAAAIPLLERLTVTPRPEDYPFLDRLLTLYMWAADYEREDAVLRKMVAISPTDGNAVLELAGVARSLNRQDEAIGVLEAYVKRRPGDLEGRRWLAQVFDSLGESDRAVEQWKVVARLAPADIEARDRLLPAPGGAPREEEIALLERQRAGDPRDEAGRLRLVALYRAAGDGPRAIAVQRELVALRPRDADALVLLARLLVERDRGPEAIAFYERALEVAPERMEVALALAQLYEWNGQPKRALAALERVAAARPNDRALQQRMAALARGTDDIQAALAGLDRLARLSPGDPKYAREAIDLLVGANRLPEAIARQRALAEREGAGPEAALKLAQLYDASGQEREAIAVYEGLDRAGALPEPSLGRLADLYRFQNRPADFLRVATRLLARRPDDLALRDAAVATAEGLSRPQEAFRLLQPVVDRRPLDDNLVLRYLGLAIQAGQPEEGLRIHRRFGVGAGTGYRFKAGRLLTDLGRYPDAITEYEAVLASAGRPADANDAIQARMALAQLYDWTGAGEAALRQWENVMRARPRDPQVLREVGRRSMALSRNDVGLRAYQALLDVRPDDPEALKRSGQLLAWSQDSRRARAALERFNTVKGGDYEVHYLLAELYTADHDEDRARAEYERALRLLPPRSR